MSDPQVCVECFYPHGHHAVGCTRAGPLGGGAREAGSNPVRSTNPTTVFVVMSDSFPQEVFASERDAQLYATEMRKRGEPPTMGRISWNVYERVLR